MTPVHRADPLTPGWIDDALARALPVSMPGSSDGPLVRFDDLRRGVGLVLADHVETRTTSDLAGVVEVLRAGERHAAAGHWVAVMLAYEAGAAFDPAFPRRPPPQGVPLAWIAAFRSCRRVAPISPPEHPPATTDIRRRGGSEWFVQGVGTCRDLIERGSTYQVNLTDRFDATLAGDPFELYRSMATAQGGACNAYLDLGDLVVASASPELFVRVERDHVVARPMKGTARRRSRPDDDDRAGEDLVRSDKDRAENVMIVDLMRNDLGRLAPFGGVTVPALFDAERYGTVWQLTSTVRAEVPAQVSLTDVLAATFPCGSVTGAPKVAAMRAIDAIEPWPRGVYCGAIGLVTPQPVGASHERPAATFSVAIRTAVVHRATGAVEFGTGAGITWSSDPVAEDTELEDKAAVLTVARPDFQLLETLRIAADEAVHLDDHLGRLAASARYFGFECDVEAARRACAAAISASPFDGSRRMRIRLAADGRWFVELHPLETAPETPVQLAVAPDAVRSDDVFCAHKTTHRTLYEQVAARHPGVDDVLLGNERGEITETCRANVLYRIGAAWFTPPLASGGLAGIGRRHLLDNGAVTERVLAVDELAEVDELAIVSSLRGRRRAVLAR